jgi:membrane protein
MYKSAQNEKLLTIMSLLQKHKIKQYWHEHKGLIFYFIRRIQRQQIQIVAGYLSYVCLMSLVPLVVVMLSVMTAFPLFAELQQSIEQFVYSNFVPAAGDVVQLYLSGFVANASKMSAVAISFLFVAALLLISSIDSTFNKIWRVNDKRRTITSFAMYWMVLTLGPILVGASIALSSYLMSIVSVDEYDVLGLSDILLRLLPLFSSLVAFVILYMAVPNKAVPFKYAISGAIVAGILFELAKKVFALYITAFPSYQVIYGALATIPIIFLWVYVSWLIVLVGALLTVSLQEYSDLKANKLPVSEQLLNSGEKL